MHTRYCLLGKTNMCYPECTAKCNSGNIYELKDRLNVKFRVIPDNIQTVTTIFNSKTLSISPDDTFGNSDKINYNYSIRLDILDESIDDINKLIETAILGKRLEGKEYTNGNLNRII